MKKFQIILGLVVLVSVLWVAAGPINTNSMPLIGGWIVVIGDCCTGWHWTTCDDGHPTCNAAWTEVCTLPSGGAIITGNCTELGYNTCFGSVTCNNTENTGCS